MIYHDQKMFQLLYVAKTQTLHLGMVDEDGKLAMSNAVVSKSGEKINPGQWLAHVDDDGILVGVRSNRSSVLM